MPHKEVPSYCHKYYTVSYESICNKFFTEYNFSPDICLLMLVQIENEYQNVEAAFHEKGPPYVRWAAKMAVGLQTGVPWIMCKQTDAPDAMVSLLIN